MIRVTELRTGNYLKCDVSNDAGIYRVWDISGMHDKVFIDRVGGEWHDAHRLSGIPLTPELLEKCGFKPIVINNVKTVYRRICGIEFAFHPADSEIGEQDMKLLRPFELFEELTEIGCDYLHQLQNLYFALTGEELKIEL